MKTVYLFFLSLCLLCFSFEQAEAKKRTKKKYKDKTKWEFGVSYSNAATSSFFDTNSDKQASFDFDAAIIQKELEDSNTEKDLVIEVQKKAELNFELRKKTIGLFAKYKVNEKLKLSFNMPYSMYTLTQEVTYNAKTYKKDVDPRTIPVQTKKYTNESLNEKTFNHIEYFGLQADYELYKDKFFTNLHAAFRLPSSFDSNIPLAGDTNSFLSDGAIEFDIGTSIGVNFEESYLQSTFIFNKRSEELSDRMLINAFYALKTVPGTLLRFGGQYIKSFASIDELDKIDYTKTVLKEEKLEFFANFTLIYKRAFKLDAQYNLPIWGKHAHATSIFTINASLLF